MKTLYELKNMKGKNSIFKSVFITNENIEGYPVVEVEPYDQTFLNATNTIRKFDYTVDRILKEVYKYFDNKTVWVNFYTEYGHNEILLSEYYVEKVNPIFN
ncbi:hypothetical protein [Mammaliicoccus sciuri]|uniref:hypothetical protein n=1 Tax=Mammaliicoccus sciuri TaxID=1296 RepID=UPI002DBDA436|nr:hypothetical protein [Mammaliicoccus sciuri]MEB6232592.1 hypothetical protein [Mammaliicoccus sciuri]